MLVQIVTENGQKKIKPLTADAGAGNPVGTIIPMYKKSSPSGYLYCDGSTFDETQYPLLYAYLGSNVLPDYREFALVGAEQNTTDTIANHDVFTEGQAKDDQLQDHAHFICSESGDTGPYGGKSFICRSINSNTYGEVDTGLVVSTYRKGTVTRGKRKAVYFYIKATSGLSEGQQDNVLALLKPTQIFTNENSSNSYEMSGNNVKELFSFVLPQGKYCFGNFNFITTTGKTVRLGASSEVKTDIGDCEIAQSSLVTSESWRAVQCAIHYYNNTNADITIRCYAKVEAGPASFTCYGGKSILII